MSYYNVFILEAELKFQYKTSLFPVSVTLVNNLVPGLVSAFEMIMIRCMDWQSTRSVIVIRRQQNIDYVI